MVERGYDYGPGLCSVTFETQPVLSSVGIMYRPLAFSVKSKKAIVNPKSQNQSSITTLTAEDPERAAIQPSP